MSDDLDSLFFPMSEESFSALSKKIEKVEFQIGEVDSQIEEIRCEIREADLVLHKVFKMWTDHEKMIYRNRSRLEKTRDRLRDDCHILGLLKIELFKKENHFRETKGDLYKMLIFKYSQDPVESQKNIAPHSAEPDVLRSKYRDSVVGSFTCLSERKKERADSLDSFLEELDKKRLIRQSKKSQV